MELYNTLDKAPCAIRVRLVYKSGSNKAFQVSFKIMYAQGCEDSKFFAKIGIICSLDI